MTRIETTDQLLHDLGLRAYRVGGSVRDELLGLKPKDADYAVFGVSLAELMSTLAADSRVLDIGHLVLRNGLRVGARATVKGGGSIEVALPRTEVSTGPGRHDFEMRVDPDLTMVEDAVRRDFTFNALYRSVASGEVFDPLKRGQSDLMSKSIHVTHDTSFVDDPLRMLRALRFVSTLGYSLSSATYWLMQRDHAAVTGLTRAGVSGTVFAELSKLLSGQSPAEALRVARDTGVLATVLPELEPMLGFDQGSRYHDLTVDEHTFRALQTAANLNAPLRVRWALLFHDSGKPEVAWRGEDGRLHYYAHKDRPFSLDHEVASAKRWRAAANRINTPKALASEVATLIENHMVPCEGALKPVRVRRDRVRLGDLVLRDLYLHRACDLSGKGGHRVSEKHLRRINELEHVRADAATLGVPSSLRDLQVNGHDAIEAGVERQKIGAALAAVLDEVVVQPDEQRLSRDWQLAALARHA